MDQREARDLDVFLLCQREQQVQELALDLEDLDHLEHAAARSVDGTGPRPGAWIALVAELCDLGEVHGADEVGNVGRRRIVWRIRANADARRFGQKYAFDGHAQIIAVELALEPVAGPRARLAADLDAEHVAEIG